MRSDAIWLVEHHESVLRLSQDEAFALNNPQLIRSAYRKVEKQEQLADAKEKFKAQDEAEDLEELGIARLGLSDRILIDGLNYAVIHWDQYTRSVGSTGIAVEAIVRGGGSA